MNLRLPVLVAIVATAVAAGCGRTERAAEDTSRNTADAEPAMDQEVAEFENRLAALEREWNAARDRIANQTAASTAAATRAVEEEVKALRQEIEELRSTTAQNWWERQERQLERAVERVQQDVRRVARDWTPAEEKNEVATSGDTDWRARREALVSRLERQIREMEQALERHDPRDVDVEQTRERMRHMKEDAERLRSASDAEWWEATKARIRTSLERLDAAIDRLAAGRV